MIHSLIKMGQYLKWGVIDIFTIVFGAKCVLFLISFKLKEIQEKEKNKKLCGCLILLSRINHCLCWKPTQNQIYNCLWFKY